MLRYLGLRRPYRFDRALVALAALAMSVAVVATAFALMALGELTFFGPRAVYFLYLLALLLLVVALVRWRWIATAVLVLAIVGSLGAILLRSGTAAEADASIVDLRKSLP